MGSFNEICALSNLPIGYENPVRILFLTANPYSNCDQHEVRRGVYHHDNWFARTPPFKGKYEDSGDANFKKTPLVDLICQVFDEDVVERPFGFNRYHTGDVTAGKGIDHYLRAAWEGRLQVQTPYHRPRTQPPENWPTWQRVHQELTDAKLALQCNSKSGKGYNAQPVIPGVICLTYECYGSPKKQLDKAQRILQKKYDCRYTKKFNDDHDACVIVTAKGAFDNPEIIQERERVLTALQDHFDLPRPTRPPLSTLAVMIREDVWQAYLKVNCQGIFHGDTPRTVDYFHKKIKEVYTNAKNSNKDLFHMMIHAGRNLLNGPPMQTGPLEHLAAACKAENFESEEELLTSCAELARVEFVMACLQQSWYIPPLGGQEDHWDVRITLQSQLLEISQKELKKQEEW